MTDVEPNLPGWRLKPPPPPSFTRPRTLTLTKTPAGGYAPVAAAAPSPAAPLKHGTSLHLPSSAATTVPPPRYVALSGVVLRWFGHFSEVVPAGVAADGERVRVRRVEVRLHLVDETVDVLERRIPNSGLAQGLLSGRAPLAIPAGDGGSPRRAGPSDFPRLGGALAVAGRAITLTDADGFTRSWLAQHAGISLGPAVPTPVGDAEAAAAAAAAVAAAAAAAARPRRARRPADGAVLSFAAAWEEEAAGGPPTTHAATLRFYVADGTVEVVAAKGGGGPAPAAAGATAPTATALPPAPGGGRVFLRRGLLPKPLARSPCPAPRPAVTDAIGSPGGLLGARAEAAASALAGGRGGGGGPPSPFLTPSDLRVGATVDVLGRPFRLLACADDATRSWLKLAGVAEKDLAPLPPPPPPPPRPRPAPPPHTPACFGSDADSARSCGPRLVPRAPVRRAPSDADARAVLSFSAVLAEVGGGGDGGGGGARPRAPPHPDASRRFTVCFYPADGALAVFEAPGDGFPGGRALDRAPVKRPGCVCGGGGGASPAPPPPGGGACGACGGNARPPPPPLPGPPPECGLPSPTTHYVEADLFIGAPLRLHGRVFLLTAAREGTLRRLEDRKAAGWASRPGALAWARGVLDAGVPGGRAAAGPRLRAALAAAILAAAGGGGAELPARRGAARAPPPPASPPDAVTPAALASAVSAAVDSPVSPPAPHVWVALWRALAGEGGALVAADAVAGLVE